MAPYILSETKVDYALRISLGMPQVGKNVEELGDVRQEPNAPRRNAIG